MYVRRRAAEGRGVMKSGLWKVSAYGCKVRVSFDYDNSGIIQLSLWERVKLLLGGKLIVVHH